VPDLPDLQGQPIEGERVTAIPGPVVCDIMVHRNGHGRFVRHDETADEKGVQPGPWDRPMARERA
jgi:hypothetical protein